MPKIIAIRGAAIVVAAMVLLSSGVRNSAYATDEKSLAQSKVLIQRGAAQYRLGNYSDALKDFIASLRMVDRPRVLLNVAQCFRQLKKYEEAISYYKRYLQEWREKYPRQPAPYVEDVKNYISTLTAALELVRKEKAAEAKKREEERRKAEEEQKTAGQVPLVPTAEQTFDASQEAGGTTRSGSKPFYKKWWFWTAVGVVVAGATTATVVALQPDDIAPLRGTMPPGTIQLD